MAENLIYGISRHKWNAGKRDIVYFSEKLLGIKLHSGQKKFLRNALKQKYYLLCPANQWGKSLSIAVLHIYCAAYKVKLPLWDAKVLPDGFTKLPYQTLYLSPRLRQARAVYGYIINILQCNFSWVDYKYWTERDPKHLTRKIEKSTHKFRVNKCLLDFLEKPLRVPANQAISSTPITYKNNSITHVVPTAMDQGAGLAGDQFPIITYDECCTSNHLEEELLAYIYSRTLKYNAPIVLVGTPDVESESFQYYRKLMDDAEEDETGDWGLQVGYTQDNIFYDQKALEKQRKSMEKLDANLARQIFYGAFVGSRGGFFLSSEVERMFCDTNEFSDPVPGRRYVIGADFAVAQNYTVYPVVDVTGDRWDLVKFIRFKGNVYSPEYQLELLQDTCREYNNAALAFDASSLAGPLLEYELHRMDTYPCKFDSASKQALLLALKKALSWQDTGRFRMPPATKENGLIALKREFHVYREKDQRMVKD